MRRHFHAMRQFFLLSTQMAAGDTLPLKTSRKSVIFQKVQITLPVKGSFRI
jgi:hypothetical protein